MKDKAPPDIVQIVDIAPHSLFHKRRKELIGAYAEVVRHLPKVRRPEGGFTPYCNLALDILTGSLNHRRNVIVVGIQVETRSLEELIEREILCTCNGIPGIHPYGKVGCYSEEQPPFCGACGEPCEVVTCETIDRVPYQEGYADLPSYEIQSSCCGETVLYNNPSCTEVFP